MMRAMEDAEFFLKKLRKRFMKKVPGWKRCTAVGDYNTGSGGELSFCCRELRITVTELPAMAAAVSSGLIQPIIASGMVRVL